MAKEKPDKCERKTCEKETENLQLAEDRAWLCGYCKSELRRWRSDFKNKPFLYFLEPWAEYQSDTPRTSVSSGLDPRCEFPTWVHEVRDSSGKLISKDVEIL